MLNLAIESLNTRINHSRSRMQKVVVEEHHGQREDKKRESLTDRMWETVKTAYIETCEENVGRRASNRKPWMSARTW